jgi:hypothetical protein
VQGTDGSAFFLEGFSPPQKGQSTGSSKSCIKENEHARLLIYF